MHVACVNQDRGIRPGAAKGARVHVEAMRHAMAELGAHVTAVDEADDSAAHWMLEGAHAISPLDLVYERYAAGRSVGSIFARRHDIPHVLEVNAPLLDEAALHRGLNIAPDLLTTERDVFGSATRIFAVSSEVADYVTNRDVPAQRVLVRPNGVDGRRFRPRKCSEAVFGIPAHRVVLGFHGRLRPWHGFERLVHLTDLLVQRGLPVHLLAVGGGPLAEAVEGRLPADRVTVLGWRSQDEVARVVARFDLMVLTYDPEAPCYFSPLKLLEAMAVTAVPVVPDLGDLAKWVHDGVNGLVYTARDQGALTERVAGLIEDPALRLELGAAARREALQHSWTAIAEDVLAEVDPAVRR